MKEHIVSAINSAFALLVLIAFAILISNPTSFPMQVAGIVVAGANLLMHVTWAVRHWWVERNADQMLPAELQ